MVMSEIKGRDSGFNLQKFRVTSLTGEIREQLGLAGVQIGERIAFLGHVEAEAGREWIVDSMPEADSKGVLGIMAIPVETN